MWGWYSSIRRSRLAHSNRHRGTNELLEERQGVIVRSTVIPRPIKLRHDRPLPIFSKACPQSFPQATHSLRVLHGAAFDIEIARKVAGGLCGFHFLLGAAAADKRIKLALRQTFVGLLYRLMHGREGGAGRRRETEAELRHLRR